MFGRALKVEGLTMALSINGDIDIPMTQVDPVTVTLVMDGDSVHSVHADEGVDFQSAGGFISLEYKPCADITHLYSKRDWRKMLARQEQDEQSEEVARSLSSGAFDL